MAFTRVNPGDPIQAHQLDQVIDALNGVAGAGQPVALTALNDATNYALTVQNDEATNSRALNVLKSDGTTLIKADVTGVTLGSPLILPSGSITSTYIADGTIQNVDLGPDVARANLLTNGGFEIWQRGTGPFTTGYSADRWAVQASGTDVLSLSRNTANADSSSQACGAMTVALGSGAGASNLYQGFAAADQGFLSQLGGKTVTFSVRVAAGSPNAVRLGINDGTLVQGAYHPGVGGYQTLTVTKTLAAAPVNAYFQIFFAASGNFFIDNAMLVVGSQPANYVPLTPADDLARCLRYYEQIGGSAAADIIVRGYGGLAAQGLSLPLPFRAVKAVSPTVTKQGTWATANCGQPTVAATSVYGTRIDISVTTAGQETYAQNSAAGTYITAEANP